jgi:putative ABC transport system permease protein
MHEDLRTALRSFRASPAFTVAALVVLTLGIGATTAIFSVVDAVVLRGLPFDEHDRLVAVGERYSGPYRSLDPNRDPDALSGVAPQNYLDWVSRQQVFESMAAMASSSPALRDPGSPPESLVARRVTASFFQVLRVTPVLGRTFTAENELKGRERVALLSDNLWRRRFGADPGIIGRTIPLEDLGGDAAADADGYEVLGVMPPRFTYPVGAARPSDIWIPYVIPSNERVRDPRRRSSYLQVIARLTPGISLSQASAQMDRVAADVELANPVWNKDTKVGVRPLIDHVVGARVRGWMLMLLGAVGLVLLIACANIASLLLARASGRERDLAVRAALGATRWRLVRQLIVESVALAVAGTMSAVVVAWWTVDVLRTAMPEDIPRVATIALDMRVLLAAAVLSLVTGLLCGIVPALQSSKPDLLRGLKDGGRSGVATGRQRLRSALVVAEVAFAVVLLVGAALFIGSFVSLVRIDPGFSPDHVLTAQISPRVESLTQPRDSAPAFAEIVERLGRIPGVVHAAMISGGVPLGGSVSLTTIVVAGSATEPLKDSDRISVRRVTPAYHQALRIPLRRGRLFSGADRQGAPRVAILNESAAKKYFPGQDPLGRTVTINEDLTVVGVVGDVHQTSLEIETRAEAYMPMAQGRVSGAEMLVRTSGDPYDVLPAVKTAVFEVLPDVPLRNVRTMEEMIARTLAQRRLTMLLLTLFGLLGLVIAVVGIYGLMAFLVAQRTHEIGVRMALGARRSQVVAMVLTKASVLVATGLVLGSVAAWYLTATARAFLYGLAPTDPRAFAAAALSLIAATLVASWIPARRAARIDPMRALRTE